MKVGQAVKFYNPFGHDVLEGVVTSLHSRGRVEIEVTEGSRKWEVIGVYEDDIIP